MRSEGFRTTTLCDERKIEHVVVQPTGMLCLSELVEDPASYFPGYIWEWFARSERWRKKHVASAGGMACAICGAPFPQVHEIYAQGMGERKCTLVPWNMICLCATCHDLVQPQVGTIPQLEILLYDPLAEDGSRVVVADRRGEIIECWLNLSQVLREKKRVYV